MESIRKPLVIILLCCLVAPVYSQEQTFQLEKSAKLLELIDLGDEGFITRFGNDMGFGKGADHHIIFFSAEGKVIWEKKLEIIVPNRGRVSQDPGRNIIISTTTGSPVYYIEWEIGMPGDQLYCTQIAKTGETKKFEIKLDKTFGTSVLNILCDDNYVYFVTTDNGNETNVKKRKSERILINRYAHKDLSHTQAISKLPMPTKELEGFWQCIGNSEGELIFANKEFDFENNKYTVKLASVGEAGDVTKNVELGIDVPADMEVRASQEQSINTNKFRHRGVYSKNLDFYVQSSNTTGNSFYVNEISAYTYVVMDHKSKALFVHGLFGPEAGKLARYRGFYIFKYNLDGTLVWKLHQTASTEMLENKFFEVNGMASDRILVFEIKPDNDLLLTINTLKGDKFPFPISSDGKLQSSNPPTAADKAPIEEGSTVKSLNNTKGSLLILTNEKQNTLKVQFFKSDAK